MRPILLKTFILITIILMDLLTGMEFDLFVPSFPELQNYFHLTPFWVEASLSVNFLGYCVSLIFVGALGDHYGRKPILLLGLSLFVIGSLLCLSMQSYMLLLLGRFIQGVGISAPAILSFLIIADAYPIKKQQFFMAILNGVMNISVAVAPVLGSYITLYFHWQGNFLTLLMLGIFTLAMTWIFIPRYPAPAEKEKLSFSQYLDLFRSKPLMLLMTNIVFMFVPYWIFVGMSPLLYVKTFRVNLSHFGYYQGVLALIFALGSILFGWMLHRTLITREKMLFVAGQIYVVSFICVLIAVISDTADPLLITLSFIPFIISQIIPSALLWPVGLNFIPGAKGKIAALMQGARLIFTALGLEIAGYFYHDSFRSVGILISIFIFFVILSHVLVLRNYTKGVYAVSS